MFTKRFCCPVNGWDCPYFDQWKFCKLVDEGKDPVLECDDAALFWEPDEDYFVWEDESRKYLLDTQDLLMRGYHFINGEPVRPLDDTELAEMVRQFQKELEHAPSWINNSGKGAT